MIKNDFACFYCSITITDTFFLHTMQGYCYLTSGWDTPPPICACANVIHIELFMTTTTKKTEPRLQTTVRQLGLESSIRHTQGWLKLICLPIMREYCYLRRVWNTYITQPVCACVDVIPHLNYFLMKTTPCNKN